MGPPDRLHIEVLGTLRVLDADGSDLTPDGALQRRLLALLVLRVGRAVSVDTAIDVLWPDNPPRDPVAALQNQISRLRRRLPDGSITSSAAGYALDRASVELDVDRLTEALSAGADDSAAAATIDEVLARWSGPAYPDLDEVDDGVAAAARLEELRLSALEARAERGLTAGGTAATNEAIAELAQLAGTHPLRERPRSLLMAALASAGRQAEALRVYDDFRRLLGDELGIEPSPSLAAEHAQLLVGAGPAPGADEWRPATRLPVPATSLVGRDELVTVVAAMLDEHRVVTLVGPGGVGKTRLAVEVGHRLRAGGHDRPVVLCELATGGEDAAIDVIAAALGIDARPGVDLVDRVADVLGDAAAVLILDNCEHVLDPVAIVVGRLVSGCPGVSVLATSRERLRVPGEAVQPVPPLSCEGADAPAAQLFVERARSVAPGFAPREAELAGVAEIVSRLDGLPLAIELAAARLHTHDLAEVAAALDQRFSLLSSGYRTSTRHGSLGAAVSWSFDLLDDDLQRTFADLSVFAGSFTAADAAAVTGTPPAAVADELTRLAERSLVMRAAGGGYVLLETLRAFGAEQLDAAGRAHEVWARYARHQVEWVADAGQRLADPGRAIAEIDAAVPELRAALGWLLDHQEVELAGRLVSPLLNYGFLRARPDVLGWAERVAAADPHDRSPSAALVWVSASYASWMAGDLVGCGARAERAREVSERSAAPMPPEVAAACASYELFMGNLGEAVEWYERSAAAAQSFPALRDLYRCSGILARAYADDPTAVALADELLGECGSEVTPFAAYAWHCAGEADLGADLDRARERFTRAIEVAERTGASLVVGLAGASRASIDARVGDPHAAADDYRRLIAHWRRAGVWSTQWTMLRSIAALLERLGRPHDAAVLEGAVRATAAGHRIFGADETTLADLGARLRRELGEEAYESAGRAGAALDGDAAVEHALRSL